MKILHVIGGELSGGAARGAFWLHEGLQRRGVESKILTNSKSTLGDHNTVSVTRTVRQQIVNAIRSRLDQLPVKLYRHRNTEIFSPAITGYHFKNHPLYDWADIIHFHWINGGFVNIKHLSGIKKPVVWTLRDMWPVTGGCHVAMGCTKYTSGCGACPQLGSSSSRDLSSYVVRRKKKHLPANLTVIGISEWISECARESDVFSNTPVYTIHNNVNCQDFFPVEKKAAKAILGIAPDRQVILVGAQHGKHAWKGYDKFVSAMAHLKSRNALLLVFGNAEEEAIRSLGIDYKVVGTLTDLISLRVVYSAADVYVSPAVMEAFGKTIAEAMACETPAVCFAATGPKDIVEHQVNGYAAVPFDTKDLAEGITWVLDHPSPEDLRKKARTRILNSFDTSVSAAKYADLYARLLGTGVDKVS